MLGDLLEGVKECGAAEGRPTGRCDGWEVAGLNVGRDIGLPVGLFTVGTAVGLLELGTAVGLLELGTAVGFLVVT